MRILPIFILLILPLALACVGPGYTCDKGAVEIHTPVNVKAAEEALVEANVTPLGQAWGVKGDIRVFYGQEYPILLYIWPEGLRIQIAVKKYERNGTFERCVFYTKPKELNVKNIVRTELTFLREKRVVNITTKEIEDIVKLAGWGLAGNMWIEAKKNNVRIEGVRGCSASPVFVLQAWEKKEKPAASSFPWTVIAPIVILLFLWLAARR